MIHKYNEYIQIQEGASHRPSNLYYDNEEFEKSINNDWNGLIVNRKVKGTPLNFYKITFQAGDDKYDYYSVIVEKRLTDDIYYLSEGLSDKFQEKFKLEFNKGVKWENFKYFPKCLNTNMDKLKTTKNFNI